MPELTRKDTLEHTIQEIRDQASQIRILAHYKAGNAEIRVPGNTTVDVIWDLTIFETQSLLNPSTGEITIPRNGYYRITVVGSPARDSEWSATLKSWRLLHMIDRGSGYVEEYHMGSFVNDGLARPDGIHASKIYKLNAGDKFKTSVLNTNAAEVGLLFYDQYGHLQIEEISDRIFPASF